VQVLCSSLLASSLEFCATEKQKFENFQRLRVELAFALMKVKSPCLQEFEFQSELPPLFVAGHQKNKIKTPTPVFWNLKHMFAQGWLTDNIRYGCAITNKPKPLWDLYYCRKSSQIICCDEMLNEVEMLIDPVTLKPRRPSETNDAQRFEI
jgi:hypothetical protein